MSRLITLIVSISTILFAYPALAWEVNENSFRCIKEMRQVDALKRCARSIISLSIT